MFLNQETNPTKMFLEQEPTPQEYYLKIHNVITWNQLHKLHILSHIKLYKTDKFKYKIIYPRESKCTSMQYKYSWRSWKVLLQDPWLNIYMW